MDQFAKAVTVISIALIAALPSCKANPKAPPKAAVDHHFSASNVSFGQNADTLLVGTCLTDDEVGGSCRVERVDLASGRSSAFTAPRGWHLSMPSTGRDGSILAVATSDHADASNNGPAKLIRINPVRPQLTKTLVDSKTEIQMPFENGSGLAYWMKNCEPRGRYCPHDPAVRWSGESSSRLYPRHYGFYIIGTIFLRGRNVYADGQFPDGNDTLGVDLTDREKTNAFWQLLPSAGSGTRKVAQRGLSGTSGAVDATGKLYLIGEDDRGMGLFEQQGEKFIRIADMSDDVIGGSLQAFSVSPDGQRAAVVMAFDNPDGTADTKLLLFDRKTSWRLLKLPVPNRSSTVSLEGK